MAKVDGEKKLIIVNQSQLFEDFCGRVESISGLKVKISANNHANAEVLRKYFNFTKPVPFGRNSTSMGLGDRLGIASPVHLEIYNASIGSAVNTGIGAYWANVP